MPAFLRAGRAAITFLTRVPVGGFPYDDATWRWTVAWFPAVGALLGAAYAGLWLAVAGEAGPLVAAVLCVIAALLVTGAFHEDGLADTADALGGAYDRDKLFAILKDSRVGAFGAAALALGLLLRVALLARLGDDAPLALVVSECVSRALPTWLMVALPYVTPADHARSRPLARSGMAQAAWATVFAGVLVAVLVPEAALVLGLVATGVTLLCGWRFRVRAGGYTGDFLGATQQVGVAAILLALVLT